MKLATLKDGSRDGRLIVVTRDLKRYEEATAWKTLQAAIDEWDKAEPQLKSQFDGLNGRSDRGLQLDVSHLMAPLPRAYEWVDGSAYINHIVLVRKARGAEPPETLKTEPLVYQGGSGNMLGPRDAIPFLEDGYGLDFESEIAVILGDTPQGTKATEADKHIKLIMLCNDVSLRGLIPNELQKGFGFFNSKPASAFSPVCVTKDELGEYWKDCRVHLPMETYYNQEKFGDPDSGPEMHFSFGDLIEHITKTRSYTAGTILGSGTVSNEDRSRGSSCLAEKRMIEQIDTGKASTPFMKPGDSIKIEMHLPNGESIFGSIEQKVSK